MTKIKKASLSKVLGLVLILITFCHSHLFATDFYVNKSASGNNNGTSWQNAWVTFSNINWSLIQPGDKIYVSGGSDSTIYTEPLIVAKSGTVGNYIQILKSYESLHSGRVVIKPNNGIGVQLNNKNYIVVKGFEISNPSGNSSDNIEIDNCSYIIIDSMSLNPNSRGIYIQECEFGIEISRNSIITVSYSTSQTDCIYSQRNREIKIWGNYLEVRNSEPNGHNDCIQSFEDGKDGSNSNRNTLTAYNNILFQNNDKQSNSSTTMMTYGWGWFTLYNNITIQPNSYVVGLGVQQNTIPGASNMKARIWNNTLIGGSSQNKCIYLRRMAPSDTVDVANNIIYTSYSNGSASIDDSPDITIKRWDNNRYFSNSTSWNGNIIGGNTFGNRTLTQWRNLGYDLNGSTGNPQMVNPQINSLGDYSLVQGSPAIDQGADLSLFFNFDKLFKSRPQGNGWDIGAYEFTGANPDLTAPELVNVVLQNPTTLDLVFSEILDQNSAQNINNYTISNNISINSISIIGNGSRVRLQTSEHFPNTDYIISVNNVTDLAGNTISPIHNSASYSFIGDVTAPELVSATLLDSITLLLDFSEAINGSSAEDENNYIISPNILINLATISTSGDIVTLKTSPHQPNILYNITVSNIVDLSGNLISNNANNIQYEYVVEPPDTVHIIDIQQAYANAWYQTYLPERSIDGVGSINPLSRWSGALPMPDTIIYDLGTSKLISKTRLSFYRWEAGRIYRYKILIGSNSNSYQTAVADAWSVAQLEWSTNEFSPIEGRYVAIVSLENNESVWAGIWETEVWGPDDQTTYINPEEVKISDYQLDQNYPNPFNPTTNIRFSIPKAGNVRITVYNLLGEHISTLLEGFYESGSHEIKFDGNMLSAGVYFYRIEANDFIDTKKMILLK